MIIGGLVAKERNLDTCELYDLSRERFQPAAKTLDHLFQFSAILLKDGRVVLAATSRRSTNDVVVSAATEIYDPEKGVFTLGPKMVTPRWFAVSAALSDGRFLFIGGQDDHHDPLYSAEIYDAAHQRFLPGGRLAEPLKLLDLALPLSDGSVLIRGRDTTRAGLAIKYERYDPVTRTFHSVKGPALDEMSQAYWAALPGGKVVFYSPKGVLSLFDPSSGEVTLLGKSDFTAVADDLKLVPLSDRKVLLSATVFSQGKIETKAAVFDLLTRVWTPTVRSASLHSHGSSTLLDNGKVLFAGGSAVSTTESGPVMKVSAKADVLSP